MALRILRGVFADQIVSRLDYAPVDSSALALMYALVLSLPAPRVIGADLESIA